MLRRSNRGEYCGLHEHHERPKRIETVRGRYGRDALPIEPVAVLVDELVGSCNDGVGAAAELLGVNTRTVHSYQKRARQTARIDILDRLLIALGREHERQQWGCFA